MRKLMSLFYLPLFWAFFILPPLFQDPTLPKIIPMGVLCLIAIGVSFLAEFFFPFHRDWNRSQNDFFRDFLLTLTNHFVTVAMVAVFYFLFKKLRVPTLDLWPHKIPVWTQLIIVFVVGDALMTFAHYLSHKSDFLWRFHSVHHSVKRLYAFNGLMRHPFHMVFQASWGLLPLLFLGMPNWMILFSGYFSTIHFLLSHLNVDMKLGIFSRVFAFAPVHRLHHRPVRTKAVNYGVTLSIWDVIFGTFENEKAIGSHELGIGDYANYPKGYFGLLVVPFKGWKKTKPS